MLRHAREMPSHRLAKLGQWTGDRYTDYKKFVLPAKDGDEEAIMFVVSEEEMAVCRKATTDKLLLVVWAFSMTLDVSKTG